MLDLGNSMVESRLLNAFMPPSKVRARSEFRLSAMNKPRFRFAEQNTAGRVRYKQPQAGMPRVKSKPEGYR